MSGCEPVRPGVWVGLVVVARSDKRVVARSDRRSIVVARNINSVVTRSDRRVIVVAQSDNSFVTWRDRRFTRGGRGGVDGYCMSPCVWVCGGGRVVVVRGENRIGMRGDRRVVVVARSNNSVVILSDRRSSGVAGFWLS
jgi:hypothetical protein